MGTKGVVIFMLLLCLPSAWGATIYGNVYDLSLSKVSGAVVEVNTTPQQKLVAQDGRYAFEIPKGTYRISAELGANGHVTARENQTVTVLQEGSYVIDLILFPVIDEGELADPGLGELGDLGPAAPEETAPEDALHRNQDQPAPRRTRAQEEDRENQEGQGQHHRSERIAGIVPFTCALSRMWLAASVERWPCEHQGRRRGCALRACSPMGSGSGAFEAANPE